MKEKLSVEKLKEMKPHVDFLENIKYNNLEIKFKTRYEMVILLGNYAPE